MSEWKEVIATDFCVEVTDGTHDSPKPVSKGRYLLTSKHLQEYQLDFANAYQISQEDYEKAIARSKVDQYDVLFSMIGTIGITHRVSMAKVDFAVKNMGIFKMGGDEIKSMWLYYWLKTRKAKEYINSTLSGTTQGYITLKALRNFPIQVPNEGLMKSITSFLSSLDDKIAVNRRICENLEAQAQALFKHWFIDFAPFLDKPSGKAERKNGKFVESELGMIPEGWRVGTLEELCSFISRGLSPKYQLGTNEFVLGQTCVRNNIVTLNNAREHQPKENCNKYVKKWDVLLNSTGIGSLGRVGVVYFDKTNVCFDSHLTVVRTKEDIYRYYVGRNLLNRQKELEKMAVGSTGQTELPKKDVLVMPILIPNSDVLPEFNEIIDNIGNEIYILIEENLRLSTLRDTLLPRLMSGKLKVNEINI